MKVNLKLMVEHLQETGSVLYPKGDVREAIKELYQMGYEVHFNPANDCLVLDNIRRNGSH